MPSDAYGRSALTSAGLSAGEVLGSGVEGTVFALRDGTVAKVWRHRPHADLVRLRAFYDAVSSTRPAVATPRILELLEVEGTLISVEERLSGDPLWVADGTSPQLGQSHVDVVLEALHALAGISGDPALRVLPVLADEMPFDGTESFERELANLVLGRVVRFDHQLRSATPDLDGVLAATVEALRSLPPSEPCLVHGDLIAANVLTEDGRATAVIDFGFLSTVGDAAFDAAIAASCFDMYGPNARGVEHTLDQAIIGAFAYDAHRLATYRAAYALVTACCFGEDVSDGHFAWCVDMLGRPDVREAIGP